MSLMEKLPTRISHTDIELPHNSSECGGSAPKDSEVREVKFLLLRLGRVRSEQFVTILREFTGGG
jgi:hypothetical protein